MKIRKILCLLLPFLFMASCVPTYVVSSPSPRTIPEITVINPATFIEIIPKGKGNKSFYSDSLSAIANVNLEAGLVQYLSAYLPVSTLDFDSATDVLIDFQLDQLFGLLQVERKAIPYVELPPSVDSVMEANHIDYAVVAMHYGFTREKGNYGAQVAKGLLLGIVTLGTVYTVPVRSASDLTVCIIDRPNHQIAFHNRAYAQDLEPLDKRTTDDQISRVFMDYFTR